MREDMDYADARIEELEQAITANDEYLQKVEDEMKGLRELNAELLSVVNACAFSLMAERVNPKDPVWAQIEAVKAKAEKLK
jgi:hypothetical protein